MVIRVNLNPLEATTVLPYLLHTVICNNSDWAELYTNLWKAQRRWRMAAKVLGNMGDPIKARTLMYKAGVQAMLLYGSKRWLAMDVMMKVLEIFHHRIARRSAGMTASKGDGGEWEWALVESTLEVTGILSKRKYTRRRQATIAEYVAGRTIYEIVTVAESM